MSEKDFAVVCSKIDENAEYLNSISQEIWKNPELGFEEVFAHDILTKDLVQLGFDVQKSYILPTAFKAEFSSQKVCGPTIAILLEYDALPGLGHACGHNLIAEAGLAAAIGIKAAMEEDPSLVGKLLLFGTPAEECGGGKIKLLNAKAFEGVDVALMVHPAMVSSAFSKTLSRIEITVDFSGKESHAAAFPWEGRNALDAAVGCYQNIAFLRQHMKPSCKIHAIITNGGTKTNIIPAHTSMELSIRAFTMGELNRLKSRVHTCIISAATSAGCTANIQYDEAAAYKNLVINKVLADLYENYANRLGLAQANLSHIQDLTAGSTDMGNVSHVVPSIHPFFSASATATCHSKEFTEVAGSLEVQQPTLVASKAMACTVLKLFRCPKTLEEVKKCFEVDILENQ